MYYQNELYHFGIKGQKWGVRRYQNPDGTLTEAGKKHYGSEAQQSKLSRLVADKAGNNYSERLHNRDRIKATPQVAHATKNLVEDAKGVNELRENVMKLEQQFYSNNKLYNKYVDKSVDEFMKKNSSTEYSRKEIREFFLEDGDQGDQGPLYWYKQSGDKGAKELNYAESRFRDASKKLHSSAKSYADSFLGSYGERTVRDISGKYRVSASERLAGIIAENASIAAMPAVQRGYYRRSGT